MQKLSLFFACALVSSAALSAAPQDEVRSQDAAAEKPVRTWTAQLGKLAPDFTLTDVSGKAWTLSALRGKTVVLEWFNPECPVVRAAHAEGGPLATLGNHATREHGAVWLAINSGAPGQQGHGVEANRAGAAKLGVEYPILIDETGWVGRAYGATTTPHMFIVDAKGVLVYAGGHDEREAGDLIGPALGEVLAGTPVSRPSTKNHGCGVKYARKAELGLAVPAFSLKDLGGETVDLGALRGRTVVLEWFNPTCPYVVEAHGEDGALRGAAARAAKDGVAWLAVNSGHTDSGTADVESNRRAAEAWGMVHPIVLDPEGRVGRYFGAKTTPHMFVLDERGVLVYAGAHADRAEGTRLVEEALADLRAGKEVRKPQTQSYGCGVKYAN